MNKVYTISLILLMACGLQEIEFPDKREVVVVEGWVTSEEKQHWVKLSRTVGFQDTNAELPIEDALVTISDLSTSTDYPLTYTSDGIYQTSSFAGIQGRLYSVRIVLSNGDEIGSTIERLNPTPDIDNIAFDSFIEEDPETGEDIEIYYPIVTTEDPLDEANYYRYKGFRNDELLNLPEELQILSDQFINGQVLPHNLPAFRYQLGDEVRVEVHSLSESAFNFLELLRTQTLSIGSSSGTAPASLVGNLQYETKKETVLGFFGASDVKSISVQVE